jgi:hypothetical protein
MKKETVYLIIAVIAVILFFRECRKSSELKEQYSNTTTYLQDSVKYYKNSLGQEIAYRSVLKGDKQSLELILTKQRDSLGQLKRLVDKYRKVSGAGNITTIIKIDSIPIPYEVEVPCEFERIWSKTDPFYKLKGTSNQFGININEIEIPNQTSFAFGQRKLGLFKTEERIEVVHSNPYIKTTDIDFYSRIVRRKNFVIAINPVSLDLITLKYSANISLGYKLFEF